MNEQIFYGGHILTMDETCLRPQAVLVRQGRIDGVGDLDALKAQAPQAELLDLKGAALLPGFIDGHSHIVQYSSTLQFASLAGTASQQEIAQRLQEFVEKENRGPEEMIIGFGYDNNDLPGAEHPTRQWLDAALPGRRVMVCHASGHMGCVNTRVLEELGITAQTPDPQGGRIGRDDQGQPNGYLEETAFTLQAAQALGQTQSDNSQGLLCKAQQVYFGYGITTAQDGLLKDYEYSVLSTAAESGALKLDVVGYADIREHSDLPAKHPEYDGVYKGHFKIGGYKLFLDGSPQGRTAWVSQPYQNGPADYRGYPVYTDQQVRDYVEQARQAGKQLLCHCNGDAAAQQFLDAHEQPSQHRDVMIHAQLLRPDQLPLLKQKNIMPSFFVAHTWYWGDVHCKNFGQERASQISPARTAQELGIPFTFHMDSPVLAPDCIDSLFCAVNRVTRSGRRLGDAQAITAYEALKALTVYGAYQYHEEDQKGTITPGKRADLVVLSADPTQVEPSQLRSIRVLATYKDGQQVFCAEQ